MVVQLPEEPLRVNRVGLLHGALLEQAPPLLILLLELLAPAALLLAVQQGEQRAEGLLGIADERPSMVLG